MKLKSGGWRKKKKIRWICKNAMNAVCDLALSMDNDPTIVEEKFVRKILKFIHYCSDMMVIDVLFLIAKLLRMATPETKAAFLAGKPLEAIIEHEGRKDETVKNKSALVKSLL
ncbi:MAG: hypothetical protein EZS28_027168 [Streblomastix strix]|uniref:Uncharacterized protein n=1 Tax=Streblomastix strix TaxID=222440 RepID=A0A5J4V3W9_9EUKA|nr:MAG: hypothetical protein EZS28_027168 [Streblomastix strix]